MKLCQVPQMNTGSIAASETFQRLAISHPECAAVKLTLDLQRAFIAWQQRLFQREIARMLQNQKPRQGSRHR
jgi:hypothetical protein